tara:strand:- start:502 stop:3282 length:2781 start_codon:yes stop_codon:yes gene_type:complete
MSVQLIIYPQYYNGISPLSGLTLEFVADGQDFGTVSTSSSALNLPGVLPLDYVIANSFTYNTWFRFSSSPNFIAYASNQIAGSSTGMGILQQLDNLSIGANYELSVNIATNNGLTFFHISGNTLVSTTTITGTGTQNAIFTASSSNDIIAFMTGGVTVINSISVMVQTQTPPPVGDPTSGAVILDLYEDENIPLTLSVDNFKNAAEKVQSYSKAFNLPATKRNNKIFDNIFEVTRSVFGRGYTFNPYVKTKCELKQDGFILFEGYLRMLDIADKEGDISYNVNLYSEVVALADLLANRTFSDLNFDELAHPYNRTQIQNSWFKATGVTYSAAETSGFRSKVSICYPYVDWNHQIIVADGSTSATVDMPEYSHLTDIFRPFIQVKYLIDRIFNQINFPFRYKSEFFDTSEFKNLYMDFNWGSESQPGTSSTVQGTGYYFRENGFGSTPAGDIAIGTSYAPYQLSQNIPFLGSPLPSTSYAWATNIFTATAIGETFNITSYNYEFKNDSGSSRTIECRWLVTRTTGTTEIHNYSGVVTIANGATWSHTGSAIFIMQNIGDTVQYQCKANAAGVIQNPITLSLGGSAPAYVLCNTSITSITSGSILQQLRGETGQWEFLKGIMTMFNLVSIPDKDDQTLISFEPYSDVFINNTNDPSSLTLAARSIQHDWTDKIDQKDIKLEVLTDLKKKTIFKFIEDDEDAAFQGYKRAAAGFLYGSKVWDASLFGSLETLIVGEEEIVAEPFSATVIGPLMPQYSEILVPKVYAYNADDGTSEGFDNSPRIMYRADGSTGDTDSNGIKTLTSSSYFVPAFDGIASANLTSYLQFSHLSGVPTNSITSTDYHFGECNLLSPVGVPPIKNLFNLYWRPYMAELYNPDTRILKVKVNLTPGDIATFNFNDTVFIKNRQYRVNSIEYKPNDLAVVEFILIP